jgi:phosphatidylglycerophosphate synthase
MSRSDRTKAPAIDLTVARKIPDAWWTALVIDPIALRILPWLVPRQRITPNGLSLASLVLALAAGGGFLTKHYVLAGVLFELHFFVDCLDGKVARLRGTQNVRGAYLDVACDLMGTSWCLAAAGLSVFKGGHYEWLAFLPVALFLLYTWSTVQRVKAGGLSPEGRPRPGGGRRARRGLVSTPYGVEAETVALFLVPLTGTTFYVRWALVLAGVFYVLASLRNLVGTYRTLVG